MPTGEAHDRAVNTVVNGEITQEVFPCRCMIGEDHIESPTEIGPGEDDEDYDFR